MEGTPMDSIIEQHLYELIGRLDAYTIGMLATLISKPEFIQTAPRIHA